MKIMRIFSGSLTRNSIPYTRNSIPYTRNSIPYTRQLCHNTKAKGSRRWWWLLAGVPASILAYTALRRSGMDFSSAESCTDLSVRKWKALKQGWSPSPTDDFEKMEQDPPANWTSVRGLDLEPQQSVLLYRAMELRDEYHDTHYTFLHGMESEFWVVHQLWTELEKLDDPETNRRLYRAVRSPYSSLDCSSVESFREVHGETLDYHSKVKAELISCDAYFLSKERQESANWMAYKNRNVRTHGSHLSYLMGSVLTMQEIESLRQINADLHAGAAGDTPGMYLLIAVPKSLQASMGSRIAFASHTFGKPCKHKESITGGLEQLERLQQDKPDLMDFCTLVNENLYDGFSIVQYRVVAGGLKNPGVMVFCLPPFDRDKLHESKARIRELAREIHSRGAGTGVCWDLLQKEPW